MGVLDRGERGDDNETGLKEGGGIEMSIYSACHIRDARSFAFVFTYQHVCANNPDIAPMDSVAGILSFVLGNLSCAVVLTVSKAAKFIATKGVMEQTVGINPLKNARGPPSAKIERTESDTPLSSG